MANNKKSIISAALISVLLLPACASVPRSDSGKLADAGISATSALSVGIRDLSSDLIYIDSTSAFSETYLKCSVVKDLSLCTETIKSEENYLERQKLAALISSKAKAVDSLKELYEAMKKESDYDAREDLTGAISYAYDSINSYAAGVEALPGARTLGRLAQGGIEAFADKKQRERLLQANESTRAATELYKNALTQESDFFEPIIDNIATTRADAVKALVSSGLVQKSDVISPLVAELGLTVNPNLEKLKLSVPTEKAIDAFVSSSSRAEVTRMSSKYKASIGALDALLKQHKKLSAKETLNFEDVNRFIDEVDYLMFGFKQEGQ